MIFDNTNLFLNLKFIYIKKLIDNLMKKIKIIDNRVVLEKDE
jgi:hypothetical protein